MAGDEPTLIERLDGGLRVLVADEDKESLDAEAAMVRELGHEVLARAVTLGEVSATIDAETPDVAMVKVEEDADHAMRLIDEILDETTCPVIVLMEVMEPRFVAEAARRGIYAYVRPITKDAMRGALEVSVRRHAELEQLNDSVDQLEGALARRATIERAKGILMERYSIGDTEAFERLRDHARKNNKRVIEVARAVVEGHALLSA